MGRTVLFLCKPSELTREREGYAKAFRRKGILVECVSEQCPPNAHLRELVAPSSEAPLFVVHPDPPTPILPLGCEQVGVPVVGFHIDTYAGAAERVRFSALFDYVVLFHPGYEEAFAEGGGRVLTLPHAVDRDLCEGEGGERIFEVAFVGRTDGRLYEKRRRLLPLLSERFVTNEWWRRHAPAEVADVYRRARIVINIPRDDFPVDANIRCFEAMGAAALLVTPLPTELSALGFIEGEHFVGFTEERELVDKIAYFLARDEERQEIAEQGRAKVLREHTYDRRVESLLGVVQRDAGKLFAPARRWSGPGVRRLYLEYYSSHACVRPALAECVWLFRRAPRQAPWGVASVARAAGRRLGIEARRLSHFLESAIRRPGSKSLRSGRAPRSLYRAFSRGAIRKV
ncbi:MAG: hypothetical protein KatS3mg082_3124 [Nitrospiraceae bacterium]|nr:MAG: hypothetical protein KatS3mg082_3124 [Nitrospiraceae bacterium]